MQTVLLGWQQQPQAVLANRHRCVAAAAVAGELVQQTAKAAAALVVIYTVKRNNVVHRALCIAARVDECLCLNTLWRRDSHISMTHTQTSAP